MARKPMRKRPSGRKREIRRNVNPKALQAYVDAMPSMEEIAESHTMTRRAAQTLKEEQWRIPKGVPVAAAMLAGEARNTLVEAMLGTIPAREAKTRIAAAIEIRDEVCGRIPSKIDLNAEMSFAGLVAAASAKLSERDPDRLPTPLPAPVEVEVAPTQDEAEA